ncbi:hypothetical protein, partial [Thermus sp.]|uniref:hypothetical protein n=1 Tax=Thermus sp. TaxID=275 RepID=UPI0025EC1C1C
LGLLGEEGFTSLADLRRAAAFFMGKEPPPPPTPEEALLEEGLPVPRDLVDAIPLLPGIVAVQRELSWGKKAFFLARGEGGRVFSFPLDGTSFAVRKWIEGNRPLWRDFIGLLNGHLDLSPSHLHMVQGLPTVRKRLEEMVQVF